MICQNCKKNTATIHLTEIINGKREEKHLCEFCAQQDGVSLTTQIPLNELLTNLLSAQPKDNHDSEVSESIICPDCQIDMKEIQQQSLLGCPNDYEFFGDSMEKIVENSQDGCKVHCGKIPKTEKTKNNNELEIIGLQDELAKAVQDERYEHAAEIRDKLKLLQ